VKHFKSFAYALLVASIPVSALMANDADNTKLNKRDQTAHEVSADNQGKNKSDTELTREIRKSVVAQKNFSTYAKNVKIITTQGQVTLKGPVKTEDEKNQIEAFAKQYAGDSKVRNEIEIKQ
jgi:hyperosmotically inducible protein